MQTVWLNVQASEIEPVRAKAAPLVEVPGIALRIAATFADPMHDTFNGVWICPGIEDGEVVVSGASPARMVQVTCQGTCQRVVGVSVTALRNAIRRHKDAHHVVLVPRETGLSLRSFSDDCTVVFQVQEVDGGPMDLPAAPAGQFMTDPFHFSNRLLTTVLHDLEGAHTVAIHPFAIGWRIQTKCADYQATAIVAGLIP